MRRFLSQSWLMFKSMLAIFDLWEFIASKLVYVMLSLIFYCVTARFSFQTMDLTRWVVGNAFIVSLFDCIYIEGGCFEGERYYGRLRFLIASPTNKFEFVLYQGICTVLTSSLSVVVSFLLGSLIFGVSFAGLNIGLFAISILSAMFACSGFCMFLAVFGLLTDSMNIVLNLAEALIIIFSGANFPIDHFPIVIQWFAAVFPLGHSIAAAHLAFGATGFTREYTSLILSELALGVVYFILAAAISKIIERISIKRATLEAF